MTNPNAGRALAYYEDFAVGDVFTSGTYRMDKARMIAFAEEYDPQPAHVDEAAARDSQFGRLVASGWQTAAVAMRLMIADALPPIAGGGVGAGVENIAWPQPVLPGDELRVRVQITGARVSRSRPDRGLMNVAASMTRQDGALVLSMSSTMVVCTRPV